MTANNKDPMVIPDPFARRLIGKYVENRKQDIIRLGQALAVSDLETIRITGHNLSGSGSAYGLDEISRLGASLEKAANARDGSAIEGLLGELKEYLGALRLR